jgi:uncharacterized protein
MSTDVAPKGRTMHCPGCGADCIYSTSNPYRPFCSARCKNHDFGAWASERFAVEADAEPGDDESRVRGNDPDLPPH